MSKTDGKKFLFLLIFLHLAVTLPLAFLLNAWMDEASTLYTTRLGLAHAFQNVFNDEKQAPLYFLLLSLWRTLSGSIFFARIPSIIFSLLAIKFFRDLAEKLFDAPQEAKFITVLFALHPYLIWASLEIRAYSLVILLSVLLLKFFHDGYWQTKTAQETKENFFNAPRTCFIVFSVIALYTNYYLGFLLVGCFAALLILRKFSAVRSYFFGMLLVGASFLPLLWVIKQQLNVRASGYHADRSFAEGLRMIWGHALMLTFPTELFPVGKETSDISLARVWLARGGLLLAAFLLVKNRFRQINEKILVFGTISLTVAVFLLAVYLKLGRIYVELRHAAILFVPIFLFAALLIISILPRRRAVIMLFAAGFVFLYPYSVYKTYPQLAKRGDWYRVARFIEANEKPNQPIIVFRNFDAISLPPHYRGVNKILPDKNFFAWNDEANFSSEDGLKDQTEFIISQIPADASEIWLATEEFCQVEESSAACKPLENFIEANYKVLITKDFYKERVRLLQRKK